MIVILSFFCRENFKYRSGLLMYLKAKTSSKEEVFALKNSNKVI